MKKLFLGLLLMSGEIIAAEKNRAPVDALAAESLWRVFGSLGLILVAIFALVWLLKRSGQIVRGTSGQMQVVDVLSLGQREKLVLVSLGEKQLVVGVSPGGVQPVQCFDKSELKSVSEMHPSGFAETLNDLKTKAGSSERAKDD